MTTGLVALVFVMVAVSAVLLVRITAENRRQQRLVQRVRTTDLYAHIYPLLRRYDNESLESVTIRPESVTIRTLMPQYETKHYTFQRHSLDNPSQETLYALVQAVLVDMRVLRNTRHYAFRSHKEATSNGDRLYWYDYVITPARKDFVIRVLSRKP